MTDANDEPQDPETIVLLAELMASSPECVRTWLEQREQLGRDVLRNWDDEPGAEEWMPVYSL
jgi:hypothetical protein